MLLEKSLMYTVDGDDRGQVQAILNIAIGKKLTFVEDDLSIGESVEALWRDEDGIDQWLPSTVLRSDMRVQYEVDNGKANIPFSWIRKVEQQLVN